MKLRKSMVDNLKIGIVLVFTFILINCSKNGPFSTEKQETTSVKKTTEQIRFLKAKANRLQKVFTANTLITAANGGTIIIGDSTVGISKIVFNGGEVSNNVNVNFRWDSQNFQAEFSPHGLTFNMPVTIRLSYKDANLDGIDEDDLRIWYYDEQDNIWELAGQMVNKDEQYVEGITTHFSRYAVAAE